VSAAQRRKGAGGERELCSRLADALGRIVKRKLGQARDSGHDIDLPPFQIECKRRKRIAGLYEWMEQASFGRLTTAQEIGPGVPGPIFPKPVVMLRADDREWLVVMRLPDWITLAREEIASVSAD
jgi:predicted transcriptional regulator